MANAQEVSSVDEIVDNLRKYVESGNRSIDHYFLEKLKSLDWNGIEALIDLIVDVVCTAKKPQWFWKVARQVRLSLFRIDVQVLQMLKADRYRHASRKISSIFSIFEADIVHHVNKRLSLTPPYFLYLELRIIEQQLADYSNQRWSTSTFIPFTQFYALVDNCLLNSTINQDPSMIDELRQKQNQLQDDLWKLSGYRDNKPFDLYIYLILDLLSTIIQNCKASDYIQKIAYLKIDYHVSAEDYEDYTYGLQDFLNPLLNHAEQENSHGDNYHPQWLIAKYVQDAVASLNPNNQLSQVVWGSLRADLRRINTKINTSYISTILKHLDLESDNYGGDQIDANRNQTNSDALLILLPSNISKSGIPRHKELALIEQHFTESYKWSMSQIAITGLGGAGKTYVAYQYAQRCIDQKRYDIVYWLHAETTVSLQNSLISLARTLTQIISPDHPSYQETSVRRLCDELKLYSQDSPITSSGMDQKVLTAKGSPTRVHGLISLFSNVLQHARHLKFLLIYDNADNIQLVTSYIPSGGNSHIIITSRNKNWPNTIDVGPFDRPTSIQYLKTEFSKSHNKVSTASETILDNLADLLGDLPLALSFATRYINNNKITISRYIEIFNGKITLVWDAKYAPNDYKEYGQSEEDDSQVIARQKTIMTTWTISMEDFRKTDELCCYIIEYLAYVRPENIPKRFITDLAARFVDNNWYWSFRQYWNTFRHRLFDSNYKERDIQHYIDVLVDSSLLYADNENYSVHRLLQQASRNKIKQDKRERKVLYNLLSYFDSYAEFDVNTLIHARQCCQYKSVSIGDSKLSSLFESVERKVDSSLKRQASNAATPAALEFDINKILGAASADFESEYSHPTFPYSNSILTNLLFYVPKPDLLLPSLLGILIDLIVNELY